jgi:hypothetical protein
MFENKLATIGMATAVGAVSQALAFGTYDYFKAQGYGGWMAGALSGGIIAGASSAILMMFKGTATEATATAGCLSGGCQGLAGVTLTQLPKSLGFLTAQQLNGVTVQQLSGQPGLTIGAIPRSAQTRRTGRRPMHRYRSFWMQ